MYVDVRIYIVMCDCNQVICYVFMHQRIIQNEIFHEHGKSLTREVGVCIVQPEATIVMHGNMGWVIGVKGQLIIVTLRYTK